MAVRVGLHEIVTILALAHGLREICQCVEDVRAGSQAEGAGAVECPGA